MSAVSRRAAVFAQKGLLCGTTLQATGSLVQNLTEGMTELLEIPVQFAFRSIQSLGSFIL